MKKFLAAALASVMLVGGAALAAADGELNICSPNSDGLLSIIPVFEEQTLNCARTTPPISILLHFRSAPI